MKLIKANYDILKSQGLFKDIEIAARTCYKSEDKITDDSADKMVKSLIERGHNAMLEHGTVYLQANCKDMFSSSFKTEPSSNIYKYESNEYSKIRFNDNFTICYVTTNYRVLVENSWLYDLKYQCRPTEFHEKRISVKFTCDRGVSHEFVRHRVFSFAQESTRYCNYSKDKFNNELTFIIPNYINDIKHLTTWELTMKFCQDSYFQLLNMGWSPQQARAVLPNSLKTELVMTGFVSDWKGFFKLRDASTAHPQAFELANPLHEKFIKLNLI